MTERVGLRPLDEEYILMGMSAYGKHNLSKELKEMSDKLIQSYKDITFKDNLHTGVPQTLLEGVDDMDIACSAQLIADVIFDTGSFAYKFVPVLEAYTWEAGNLSTGTGTLGYQLENRTGATQNITASLYILSTEE